MLDLLYPRRCASCGERGRVPLCEACDAAAAWIDEACRRCALPACRGCDGRGAAFDAAASAARYQGAARDALIAFKLLGERRAAAAMAGRMGDALARIAPPPGAPVTFVPSSAEAMRQRGFNPARTLAIALARTAGRPALPLLRKTRRTPDLAGLGRAARRAALEGAFACAASPPDALVLVDDVLTTGATASACARALKSGGAGLVAVVTFARAV